VGSKDTTASSGWDALIGLGSNIGDKRANIAHAIGLLTQSGDIRLVSRSRDYRTAPWGKPDQDWFVNACISVATKLPPLVLLRRCQKVETELGRVRGERWGPRVIDVDVLIYRDAKLSEPELTLPHPLIAERAFVLVPLIEIAPALMIKGRPLREHLAAIPHEDVQPLGS
jgi:2-amino-4-hydroxy-6-hydroxymethyldihydropteridine diphosphokinase